MPKFAANLSTMFTEADFLDRFALARAHGFAAVECQFPYAWKASDIRARLDATGLDMVLHNLPAGDWAAGERGIACDPARTTEFRDGVAVAIDYALALGVQRLHCLAGKLPDGVAHAAAHGAFLANLRYAADTMRPHGLNLLVEPINTYDIPGYFLSGSHQAARIIAECGAPNLFLQYDLYHMQRMEGELAATIQALLPVIGHIQVADNPGRHEPGTGEINFPFLFRRLDELGYGGWIGCEYTPVAGTAAGLGWLERLDLEQDAP